MSVLPAPRAAACRGAWRVARASAVASVAVLVAVWGHLTAGGAAPGAQLLALVVVLASVLCAWLSRRRWSVRTLTGGLLATQALMHLLCGLGAPPSSGSSATSMVVGHLLATGISLVVLMHAEALAWRLVDAVALRPVRAALDAVRAVALPAPPKVVALGGPEALGGSLWAGTLVPVRGPPA